MGKLTHRQRMAADEFLACGNQVKSCLKAGYSAHSVNMHATRVFALPQVKAYLAPLIKKLQEKSLATAERVLEELASMAMSNLAAYYKLDAKRKKWVLKDLNELTEAQQRCMSEFKPGEYIKLYSKDSALDKLAKHFKLYTDLEAGTANFTMMPTLRISGKEVIFEVGKPAPQAHTT